MKILESLAALLVLAGVVLISWATATPGDQYVAAISGGAALTLGVRLAIECGRHGADR